MILDNDLMTVLDEIQPENSTKQAESFDYARITGCGCTGNCGQSCSGGCMAGCSGNCGRSCSGACS